jgi:mycofactocin system glycosyltransferase
LLEVIRQGGYIPLSQMTDCLPQFPPQRIEFFLNDLVRKGFCDQKGILALSQDAYPLVSIIIPVRNRPQEISDCLSSLMQINYPKEKTEIIVLDDASDDHTPQVVAQFPVRLIKLQKNRQASFCRNLGARHAEGEILAFIDSDCLADPQWLRELVPAFREPALGAIGGWVDAVYEAKALDCYEKVKSALKMGAWFKRSQKTERFFYVPTCNLLVKKDLFLNLGGFREELHVGEDVDFCWRLQDSGFLLDYRPVGKVYHKHRNQPLAFCIRRFDYGTSEPLLQRLHPLRIKQLWLPPPETLFWILFFTGVIAQSLWPLTVGGLLLLLRAIRKHVKLRSRNLPIRFWQVLISTARSHLAFMYHLCSFGSRYYLIFALLLFPFFPLASGIICAMHILAGVVEYSIKKPQLNPVAFLFYFSLEQISYQAGVWWGCFKQLNFSPILPKVVHKKP